MAQNSNYKAPTNLKSRLRDSYDAIAPRYNEWTTIHAGIRLQWLEKLVPHLLEKNEPVSVLELGCGCGLPVTQKLLSNHNISVIANDLSSTQIAIAKENLASSANRITFLEGDMLTLDLAPEYLEEVVAFYSIIHLPRDEQCTLLEHIAKWLKPGGYLLANFSAETIEGSEMEKWLKEDKGWMFWSGWGTEGTIGKIKDAGLNIAISEVQGDAVDAMFLWVLARKPE